MGEVEGKHSTGAHIVQYFLPTLNDSGIEYSITRNQLSLFLE